MDRRERWITLGVTAVYAAVVAVAAWSAYSDPLPPPTWGTAALFGWQGVGALVVGGVAGYFLATDGSALPLVLLAVVVALVLTTEGAASPDSPATRPGLIVVWGYLSLWPAVAVALALLGLLGRRVDREAVARFPPRR